jgi:transcriptional regulator with GAF, ATPase, and Fis domain
MVALTQHTYTTHVRQLEGLLWASLSSSTGDSLELTDAVKSELLSKVSSTEAREVTAEQVDAALQRAGGVQGRAWRELGLANRYVLKRLIKKFGLQSTASRDNDDHGES